MTFTPLMGAQMGLSLLNSFAQFGVARAQASLQERMQEYNNDIQALRAARAKNANAVNRAALRDSAMESDFEMQRMALQDQSVAEVAAAAAGVKGNNVDMIQRDLAGSAARASFDANRRINNEIDNLTRMDQTIDVEAILGKDVSLISKPSVGAALLGAGLSVVQIYDSHQPEGQRTSDLLGAKLNERLGL